MSSNAYAESLNRAAQAIKGLRQQLEKRQHEPIAIIGMSCRFPGGVVDPAGFWNLLITNTDAISEIPADRWNSEHYYDANPDTPGKMATRWGGFIDDIDQFDAPFFSISPREAYHMDPRQRLLLETSWEALEYAGQSPSQLAHSKTGIYIGLSGSDYLNKMMRELDWTQVSAYFGSGNTLSVAAGRIAHILGLNGPALAVDTACSSSLVALQLACQSLRAGQIDMALVGGANLVLDEGPSVAFSKARMLASDGRCKTFASNADGYVRSDGCSMVVVKRLSDAEQNGDNILAVIHGIATNHDGKSSGLTVPSGQAQQQVINEALANAPQISPESVSYVETHGTGTPLGDPIELKALAKAYQTEKRPENPLLIGSVKTNVGHLETSAGMAGLLKLILAMQHGLLPAHLHADSPTQHVDWNALNLDLVQTNRPWTEPRVAGLSSFGFSGTNAHLILSEYQPTQLSPKQSSVDWHILPFSAKNESALTSMVQRYYTFLADNPTVNLAAIAYTLQSGRAYFPFRTAILANTIGSTQQQLAQFLGKADQNIPDCPDNNLKQVAKRYLAGETITWSALWPNEHPRPIPLPTYPFQRERFWFTPSQNPAGQRITGTPTDHRLLGTHLSSPLQTAQFATTWQSHAHPLLHDYTIFGQNIAPVAIFVELALSAATSHWGAGQYRLQDLRLLKPLVATPDLSVQTTLTVDGLCQVFSQAESWVQHMSVRVRSDANQPPEAIDLNSVQATCPRSVDVASHYTRLRTAGLVYRRSTQLLAQIWLGENCAVGKVALPAGSHSHLLIFDACFQLLGALLPENNQLYLPTQIEQIAFFGDLPSECWVKVEINPGRGNATANFYNNQGQLLLSAQNIQLEPFNPQPTSSIQTNYQVDPQLLEAISQAQPTERESLLTAYLQSLLSQIVQRSSLISPNQSLYDMGLDSLMAVELKNALTRDFNIDLPLADMLDDPTIVTVSRKLNALIEQSNPSTNPAISPHDAQNLLANLDDLSEDDMDNLLAQLMP